MLHYLAYFSYFLEHPRHSLDILAPSGAWGDPLGSPRAPQRCHGPLPWTSFCLVESFESPGMTQGQSKRGLGHSLGSPLPQIRYKTICCSTISLNRFCVPKGSFGSLRGPFGPRSPKGVPRGAPRTPWAAPGVPWRGLGGSRGIPWVPWEGLEVS